MKTYFISSIITILSVPLVSQDYFLSQNMQLPMFLNPAFSGSGCGLRVSSFYQNISNDVLATGTYQTFGIGADAPIEINSSTKLGFGYHFIGDVAGEVEFASFNHKLAASITKSLVRRGIHHSISLGGEGGFSGRSINQSMLRWPSQITANGFNPDIPSGEPNLNLNFRYLDFSIGLAWSAKLKNGNKLMAGLASYHINKPNISFLGTDSNLKMRMVTFASAQLAINEKWSLVPTAIYSKQGISDIYNLSIGGKFMIHKQFWLQSDVGYIKYSQPFLGLTVGVKDITIAANYNFSNDAALKKAEISVIYIFNGGQCEDF